MNVKASTRRGNRLRRARRGGGGARPIAEELKERTGVEHDVREGDHPRHADGRGTATQPHASRAGSASTPVGPTVYSRIHIGTRGLLVFSTASRFLAHGLRGHTRQQRHRCQRQDLHGRSPLAGCSSSETGARDDRPLQSMTRTGSVWDALTSNRWPPSRCPRSSPISEALIERGHAYEAGGDVYFPGAQRCALRHACRSAISKRWTRGRAWTAPTASSHPLDFALWKAHKDDEDSSWPSPWGRGSPRLAHRVFGDGQGGPSASTSRSMAADWISLFPHHENEAAQTRCASRRRACPHSRMHNGMLQVDGGEGRQVAGKHRPAARGARRIWPAMHVVMYFLPAATTASRSLTGKLPLAPGAAKTVARLREAACCLTAGASPPELAHLRERFFAALADDFNTAEALPSLWEWVREANRRARRRRLRRSARDA